MEKPQEAIPKPHLLRQCRSGEMHVNLGDRITLASFVWEFRGKARGEAHGMEKPVSAQCDRGKRKRIRNTESTVVRPAISEREKVQPCCG